MAGNERYLIPELLDLALGKKPATQVYADPRCEKFAGAKRGGSPNLAKLGNAARGLDKSKNYKKLGFEEPDAEFIAWMEFEKKNGWMWNEQGPSPIYDWYHLLPQLVWAVNGSFNAKALSNEWIRQFLLALHLGLTPWGEIAQAGMRGVGHKLEGPGFNEWLLEFSKTGNAHNRFFKKHFNKNRFYQVCIQPAYAKVLREAWSSRPDLARWPVRVEQRWYIYEHGTVVLLTRDGNGNTQARAAYIAIQGRPRAMMPLDGGKRKQGDLDGMRCWVEGPNLYYASDRFTGGKTITYSLEGSGKLLRVYIWNNNGMISSVSDPEILTYTAGPSQVDLLDRTIKEGISPRGGYEDDATQDRPSLLDRILSWFK